MRERGSMFIRIQNVGRNQLLLDDVAFIDPPVGAEAERTRVMAGDVLLSITADLGRTAVVPIGIGSAHINQHLAILRLRDMVPRFVAAFIALGPGRYQLEKLDRGGVKSGLNFADVRSLRIPRPPLAEQRRIADILDKADAIRRKREQAIALTDDLLRSVFLEMFADHGKYPTTTIGAVCDVGGGLQVSAARSGDILVPYLRVANVHRDRLDLSEIKSMRVTPSELERTALAPGDVLVVEGHGNAEELGRAAVWTGSVSPCIHQNHLIRVRCRGVVLPEFVGACLNGPLGRDQMLRRGNTTSGLNTISTSAVRSVAIPLPPISHQQEFSRRIAQVRALRDRQLAASECSGSQFAGLISLLFRDAGATPAS
jgi:type I restriction enzyme S subunit